MVEKTWNYWTAIMSQLSAIEQISDGPEKEKQKELLKQSLSSEWSKTTDILLERFTEIGTDIGVLSIPERLLNLLKEALFCYLNEQYISTIATSGAASEIFCSYLYSLFLSGQGWDEFSVRSKINLFNDISQTEKIDVLSSVVHIADTIIGRLTEIRRIRNKNIHLNGSGNSKQDALICLKNLIEILHLYSNYINSLSQQHSEQVDKEVGSELKDNNSS